MAGSERERHVPSCVMKKMRLIRLHGADEAIWKERIVRRAWGYACHCATLVICYARSNNEPFYWIYPANKR